jgi:hypothetical protein
MDDGTVAVVERGLAGLMAQPSAIGVMVKRFGNDIGAD